MTSLSKETKRTIGQRFVLGFHGHVLNENIKTLIRDYHVGNIILMKRNVKNAVQVRRLVSQLQAFARECGHERPLLIGTDQENGLVAAFSSPTAGTQFPGAMAIAATDSTELAEKVAAACGKELKLVGINWVYSPVADVNSDPKNPVIGVRSFGDDPEKVARFACAVSRGLASSGIAPCVKHFPGHGDTHVDSHLALPKIMKDKEALKKTELVPFESLVLSGVASIMTGHMALPLITGGDSPSSLSAILTTALLREEMRYRGVIVTDCLEMAAISDPDQGGCGVEQGAVKSLEAGADIAMICHTMASQVGAIEAVWEAVQSGRLKEADVRNAEARIAKMKDEFVGEWDMAIGNDDSRFQEEWKTLKEMNATLSQEAYRKSTTLVWERGNILPLTQGSVMLLAPGATESCLAFARAVGERAPMKYAMYTPHGGGVTIDPASTAILFVLRNAARATWQQSALIRALKQRKKHVPFVIISICEPYDLIGTEIDTDAVAYIQTYEYTAAALEAAVETLFDLIR